MGEILFSLFIGGCLIVVGLILNLKLYREEKNLCTKDKKEE